MKKYNPNEFKQVYDPIVRNSRFRNLGGFQVLFMLPFVLLSLIFIFISAFFLKIGDFIINLGFWILRIKK